MGEGNGGEGKEEYSCAAGGKGGGRLTHSRASNSTFVHRAYGSVRVQTPIGKEAAKRRGVTGKKRIGWIEGEGGGCSLREKRRGKKRSLIRSLLEIWREGGEGSHDAGILRWRGGDLAFLDPDRSERRPSWLPFRREDGRNLLLLLLSTTYCTGYSGSKSPRWLVRICPHLRAIQMFLLAGGFNMSLPMGCNLRASHVAYTDSITNPAQGLFDTDLTSQFKKLL